MVYIHIYLYINRDTNFKICVLSYYGLNDKKKLNLIKPFNRRKQAI